MAEQKKGTSRAKATTTKTEPEVKEAAKVNADKLSREGRRQYRMLISERNRIDSQIKQALKLRSRLDAIDKEISNLK